MHLSLAMALLALSNAANAASFNCAKAFTKVEKMICADPEVSKLDEELGEVFKTATNNIEKADDLRKNQLSWLKWYRNRCVDSGCLKEEYRKKIEELRSILAYDFSVSARSYPPYPAVWHQVFPLKGNERGLGFTFFKMKNGDYIVYFSKLKSGKSITLPRSFFEEDISIDPKSEAAAFYKLDYVTTEREIELKGKSKIVADNLDHRMRKFCPQSLNNYYEIKYPDGRTERKSLLFLNEKPSQVDIDERCPETNEKHFDEKVSALMGDFLPLRDGGFLLSVRDAGIVLRFDAEFRTKSSLEGKKLFVVDTDQLVEMGVNQYETMNYQNMQNKIFRFLGTLK